MIEPDKDLQEAPQEGDLNEIAAGLLEFGNTAIGHIRAIAEQDATTRQLESENNTRVALATIAAQEKFQVAQAGHSMNAQRWRIVGGVAVLIIALGCGGWYISMGQADLVERLLFLVFGFGSGLLASRWRKTEDEE